MNLKSNAGRLPSKSACVSMRSASRLRCVPLSCVILFVSSIQFFCSVRIREHAREKSEFLWPRDVNLAPIQYKLAESPIKKVEAQFENISVGMQSREIFAEDPRQDFVHDNENASDLGITAVPSVLGGIDNQTSNLTSDGEGNNTSNLTAPIPPSGEMPTTRLLGFPIHKNNVFRLRQVRSEAAVAAGREYTARARERAALPEGFGKFGINQPQPPNASVIKRIWIWGERSSCTTAITELLMNNFVLACDTTDPEQRFMGNPSCVLGGCPWKHGSMQYANLQNKEESLNIFVSRHAYEWAASLRRSAPHASIHQGRSMPDFLTLEWVSLTVSGMLEQKLNDHIAGMTPLVLGRRRLLEAYGQGPPAGPAGRRPTVRTPRVYNDVGATGHSEDGRARPHGMRTSESQALAAVAAARASAAQRAAGAVAAAIAADGGERGNARRLGMRRRGSGFRVDARNGPAPEDGGRRPSATRAKATAATAAAGRRLLEEDREFEYIAEMTSDRDVETGDRYPTVIAMRQAKLRDWARVAVGLPFAEHVACRDFMLDPGEMLEGLERKFGLTRKNPEWDLGGCVWRQGQCVSAQGVSHTAATLKEKREHYLNMRFMSDFDEHTLAIANAWLDPELEGLFGYRLFDSLQDAAQPYTRQNRCSVHGSCSRQ